MLATKLIFELESKLDKLHVKVKNTLSEIPCHILLMIYYRL